MTGRRILFVSMGCLLVLAGCITIQYPAGSPTATAPVATIPGTETSTSEPQIIYITATPQTNVIVVTSTPEPATATVPATEVPVSLTLTSVIDNGSGLATIYWDSSGSFPAGYELVWSATNTQPTFPTDTSTYISNSSQRSAQIQGEIGRIYYIRLCRYVNGACDLYSNVGIVGTAYPTMTATPVLYPFPNIPPNPPAPRTTATTGSPYITITSVKSTGAGAARIYWRASGDFPKGFLILYVEGTIAPSYGDYSYYSISDGSIRSAVISGNFGGTYTFRICRYTGTSCDTYSNAYEYTFSGITPTSTGRPPNPRPPHEDPIPPK
jgi:hypothetical protein